MKATASGLMMSWSTKTYYKNPNRVKYAMSAGFVLVWLVWSCVVYIHRPNDNHTNTKAYIAYLTRLGFL